MKVEFSQADLAPLLSDYLVNGRKAESWSLQSVTVDTTESRLVATLDMTSTYSSATDRAGFHLTIFTSLEFTSQLMIIYAHVWAGLDKKVREGWMVESKTRTVKAIRDSEGVLVEMHVKKMRQRGVNLYCDAHFKITDTQGGLFEVDLKGFLA